MNPKWQSLLGRSLAQRYVLTTVGVIFLTEFGVMRLLEAIAPEVMSGTIVALLDATALVAIVVPILWWTTLRPVRDLAIGTSEEYKRVLDHAADAIVVIDQTGIIETFNRSAERVFGHAAEEMVGKNISLLMPEPDRSQHDSYMLRYLSGGEPRVIGIRHEVVALRKNGEQFPAELHISAVHGCGRIMFAGIVQDISERREVQKRMQDSADELARKNDELERMAEKLADINTELAHTARIDALTGLWSRRAWHESAHLEHERFERYDCAYAIVMIDVDHFKAFNDTYGHPAGDDCLRKIAQALGATARATDLLGRYGGEEFTVLVPEVTEEGARRAAERMLQAVRDLNLAHRSSSTADRVTISVGAALCQRGQSVTDVIAAADRALYAAKHAGRNRSCMPDQVESLTATANPTTT